MNYEANLILIVDDLEENLLLLKRILSRGGFQVEATSKSSDVLRMAKELQPALIILDINMPDIDGFEACRQLKSDPLSASIPVIFVTALESTADRLRGFEAGAVDYIVKPIEIEETLARVRTQITIYSLQKRLEQVNEELDQRLVELTQSQQQIHEREIKLHALVKALPNMIFVHDEEGRYLEIFSNEAQNIVGKREEMLGKKISEYLPPEVAKLKLEAINAVLKTEQTQVIEYPLTFPNGKQDWFEGRIALMEKSQPGKGKVICVTTEITERMNLFKKIELLAIKDPLTNCYNRRHFLNLSEKEIARSNRFEHPLSLMILDIDHFKKVNDTYGHPVGDEVLKKLVQICLGSLRPTDVIGRYGGEEFCILFPETGMQGAYQVAERIRKAIESTKITTKCGELSITVSAGLACLEEMGEKAVTISDFIEEADKALYTAKREGRNRIHTNCQGIPVGFDVEYHLLVDSRGNKSTR